MSPLFQAAKESVESLGWEFRRAGELEVLEAQFEAHHTRVLVHLQAFPEVGVLHAVGGSRHSFSPRHLAKLCELLMRATNQVVLGGWEVRWDDGTVHFRVSQIFPPQLGVHPAVIDSMIHTVVAEVDRLTPALAQVAGTEPAELALLDVPALLAREDWLPPGPDPL